MLTRHSARRRIVSLTPTALARDSRTLKAAAAYARFGFDSMVIEGIASASQIGEPGVTVRSIASGGPGPLLPTGRKLMRGQRSGIAAAGVFAAFLCFYVLTYCLRPLRAMRRAALYHLHSYEYFPLVWLWCRLFGGRYIYDAHDFYSGIRTDAEMSPAQRGWIRPFQLWLERKCVDGAAAFLTVNEGTATLMQQQFGRRPTVLRNCHDFRLDRRPDRTVREAAGIAPDGFLIVCPGHWKPGQSTAEAIEALSLLPEQVHLAFVGGGFDWCREFAERQGVAERVHLVGPAPANAVVPFIASADAALVYYDRHNANYAQALPNGFFQSLAAGLPLVYSDLPGMTEAAASYGLGAPIAPRSAAAVADAIRGLLLDPAEQHRRRMAARSFSSDVNFQKEEEILRAIVAGLVGPGARSASDAERPGSAASAGERGR